MRAYRIFSLSLHPINERKNGVVLLKLIQNTVLRYV